ncbi:MAG: ribonuclease Z [Clostridia bacterium]|nr:ribonuclease Z [Clostridia bacterium]
MLEVCLLGCSGMMPLPNRWLTSLLVRYNGRMILIDCGEGTQIPVKLAGWGFKAIDALCLTHYHADHVSGLPGFLLTLGNYGRVDPLVIMGPPGLEEVVSALTIICPELPYEIRLVELPAEAAHTYRLGDILIHSLPVDHWIPCLAYSLEIRRPGKFDAAKAAKAGVPIPLWKRLQKGETVGEKGRVYTPDMVLGRERKGMKISYCTDTRPTQYLLEMIEESDILILEGMYGDNESLEKAMDKKHMLFAEAAWLARKSRSKELWLTHFSPALDKPEEFLDNAREIFKNTFLGENVKKAQLFFHNED